MTIQSWILYLTFVLIATATPGPAVLFITTNSMLYGWQKTVFAALGNIVGLFTLGIIAITGLGAILKTSVVIYSVVKYLGAAYLIFLGFRMFYQGTKDFKELNPITKSVTISSEKLFLQAFGVAVSNPKAIVFLTALFPQFIDVGTPLIPQYSVLILTLMAFSFSFLLFYSVLAHQAKGWLSKPGRQVALNRTSGTIFIGFGILLAASTNK
ncbi:MAG: LysE family translocator [Desulfobacteraceae bacterium]